MQLLKEELIKYPAASYEVFAPAGHLPSRHSSNIHASMAIFLIARGNKSCGENFQQPQQVAA